MIATIAALPWWAAVPVCLFLCIFAVGAAVLAIVALAAIVMWIGDHIL